MKAVGKANTKHESNAGSKCKNGYQTQVNHAVTCFKNFLWITSSSAQGTENDSYRSI